MIQIQVVIRVPGDDKNTIDVNILEREDANDREREFAGYIEELYASIFETIRARMPSDVEITRIDGNE